MKPTGTVTFLFNDIEDNAKLSQQYPGQYPAVLEKINTIIHKAVESNNGFVFKTISDAFCCAFQNADDAVLTAFDIQKNLDETQTENEFVVKLRTGIHSGYAEWKGEDYLGYITLAVTSRIMSAANGEQILISKNTYEQTGENLSKKFSYLDLGLRRLKDLVQPIKLFQLKAPGLREDFPPLLTLDVRPNNLPVQVTSYVGRENDILKIKSLLKQSRLVTILGTGGVGKTRLAIQITADIIDDFVNGVWIAELGSVYDSAFLIQTIITVFKINVSPGKSPEETLFDYLREKKLLIIMDNCEHLINQCSALAENLLNNCPGLKIIATSRQALNCSGEQIYRISSLTLPDESVVNTPGQISQFESVRLFIERAAAVNQNFNVTNENVLALAGICNQLDGIPLAIELAAARTKILTVEKIHERLKDRFGLLIDGKRTSLPRQQTLRALIDWSYDLLTENEKLLFARLSVFSDGWSMDAAEYICSDDLIDQYEVLDLLSNLIDKSIVISKETNGVTRYSMLETIKQYSLEKLDADDEIYKKYSEFYLKIAAGNDADSDFKTRMKWKNDMELEQENIRSSIRRSLKISPSLFAGLVIAFSEYLEINGYYKEAFELLNSVIESNEKISQDDRATVLINAAYLASFLDKNEIAVNYINQAIDLCRETGNNKCLSHGLSIHGIISFIMGDMKNAVNYTEQSIKILECLNERTLRANALGNLAAFKAGSDTFEESLKLLDDAIKIYHGQSQDDLMAKLLISKGGTYYQKGDYENAKKYFNEGLPILLEVNDQYSVTTTLYNLGNLNLALNNYPEAEKYFEEAMMKSKENGYTGTYDRSYIKLGEIALIKNEKLKAKEIFVECLKHFNKKSERLKLVLSIYGLGNYYFLEKNYDLSAKYFFLAEKINSQMKFNLSKWRESENEKILLKLKNELNPDIFNKLKEEINNVNTDNAAEEALDMAFRN